MSMDFLVLTHSIVGIILFVGVHALVVRFKGDSQMLLWIVAIFIGLAIFLTLSEWQYLSASVETFVPAVIFTVAITGLVDFCYVLALFGIATTSVRMQILMELSKYKDGMTKRALLLKYNKRHVVGQRVERLISSGELEKKDEEYRMGKSFSYFNLHTQIISLLFSFYGKDGR